MKYRYMMTFFCLLFSLMVYGDSNSDAEAAGEAAAISWLSLIDAGEYSSSWQQSAKILQSQIDETAWVKVIGGVRKPLGGVLQRSLAKSQFASSLPGVPDGQYVIAVYNTKYENKESATETVTTALDDNNKWRVAGYFIN